MSEFKKKKNNMKSTKPILFYFAKHSRFKYGKIFNSKIDLKKCDYSEKYDYLINCAQFNFNFNFLTFWTIFLLTSEYTKI